MKCYAQILACLTILSVPLAFGNPDMSLEKVSHNFGKVFAGQPLEHSFPFKNDGTKPLKILGINTSCGCTVSDTPIGQEIQPKMSSTIKIKFDTSDFKGKVSKSVIVVTNEKVKSSHILTFSADIETRFIVRPPVLSFHKVSHNATPSPLLLEVKANNGIRLNVTKISYPQRKLSVAKTINIDGSLSLSVQLKEGMKTGFFNEEIEILTGDPITPRLYVPVTANVLGPIDVASKEIELGSIQKAKEVKRSVLLTSKRSFEPKIKSLALYLNGRRISDTSILAGKLVQQAEDKKQWALELSVQNLKDEQGTLSGKIVMGTNVQEQRNINIHVHGLLL